MLEIKLFVPLMTSSGRRIFLILMSNTVAICKIKNAVVNLFKILMYLYAVSITVKVIINNSITCPWRV